MAFGIAHWKIILIQLVLLVQLSHGCAVARKLVDSHNGDAQLKMTSAENIHDPSPKIDRSALRASVFFNLKDLEVGKRKHLYFLIKIASVTPLLPKDDADLIPFSLKELGSLLKFFSINQGSKQSEAMEKTLRDCEALPLPGETKFCATSLESMLDFILHVFETDQFPGDEHYPMLLTSSFKTTSSKNITSFQNYTILEMPREVSTSKMVGCHVSPYPYTVFYCHTHEGNKVYQILFGGENGDTFDVFATCHQDTSHWDPNHDAFRALGTEPGNPVCHFFPPHGNLLWVRNPTTAI